MEDDLLKHDQDNDLQKGPEEPSGSTTVETPDADKEEFKEFKKFRSDLDESLTASPRVDVPGFGPKEVHLPPLVTKYARATTQTTPTIGQQKISRSGTSEKLVDYHPPNALKVTVKVAKPNIENNNSEISKIVKPAVSLAVTINNCQSLLPKGLLERANELAKQKSGEGAPGKVLPTADPNADPAWVKFSTDVRSIFNDKTMGRTMQAEFSKALNAMRVEELKEGELKEGKLKEGELKPGLEGAKQLAAAALRVNETLTKYSVAIKTILENPIQPTEVKGINGTLREIRKELLSSSIEEVPSTGTSLKSPTSPTKVFSTKERKI